MKSKKNPIFFQYLYKIKFVKTSLNYLVGYLILCNFSLNLFVITCMVTELYYFVRGRVTAICDLESNLVGIGSLAKINLMSNSDMKKIIIWWLQQGSQQLI